MWIENKFRLMKCYYGLMCIMGQQRSLLNAPLTRQIFGTSAVEVCQSISCLFLTCITNSCVIILECPLSVFQGLCLRGERQKHAGAKVSRVPMWYSCRSHRHKSPRSLLQSGCHYRRRLCMNELICYSETSYQALIWVTIEEREKIVFILLVELSRATF